MAEGYAYLAIWLIGLFGIVFTVSAYVTMFVMKDSLVYDEQFVWRKKLPPDVTKKH
ncbi:MAG: hypothetical protein ACE3L7_31095 [Candidatus Pristimantibacillus sp.]